jgi:ABC-type nickel/cobalt efflux system permease component RcnA
MRSTYAIFHNYNATKSVALALSTSILQQLAVVGAIFLFLRWRGEEVNRGR